MDKIEDNFSVKRVNGKKVKTKVKFRQRSLSRNKNSKTRIGKELEL